MNHARVDPEDLRFKHELNMRVVELSLDSEP